MVMGFPEQPHDERTRRRILKSAHEEAERVSVPVFDWVAEPIGGMIDAAIAVAPHRHRHEHDSAEGEDRRH